MGRGGRVKRGRRGGEGEGEERKKGWGEGGG